MVKTPKRLFALVRWARTVSAETEIPENDRATPAPAAAAASTTTTSAAPAASGFRRRGASSHRDCGYANGTKKIHNNHGGCCQHAHELAAQTARFASSHCLLHNFRTTHAQRYDRRVESAPAAFLPLGLMQSLGTKGDRLPHVAPISYERRMNTVARRSSARPLVAGGTQGGIFRNQFDVPATCGAAQMEALPIATQPGP